MTTLKTALAAVVGLGLLSSAGFADISNGVDPGYVRVKVYEVRVSPNADCTAGITVFRDAAPSFSDWTNSPTIGSGAIPNGSYPCIMMKMSDNIHYSPASTHASWTHGACVVGTDYTLDVGHDETATDPEGISTTLGPRGTDNLVWLYIHQGANRALSTWVPAGGLELTNPLVVSGDRSNTMVFDFSSKVGEEFDGAAWQCGCDAPTMSFR